MILNWLTLIGNWKLFKSSKNTRRRRKRRRKRNAKLVKIYTKDKVDNNIKFYSLSLNSIILAKILKIFFYLYSTCTCTLLLSSSLFGSVSAFCFKYNKRTANFTISLIILPTESNSQMLYTNKHNNERKCTSDHRFYFFVFCLWKAIKLHAIAKK